MSAPTELRNQHVSVTVTAVNRETGAAVSAVGEDPKPAVGDDWRVNRGRRGSTRAALRAAITQIERNGGTWQVLAISTPQTIYTDLTRLRTVGGRLDGNTGEQCQPTLPEKGMLCGIGRLDLL
ncbi:MAG: hypothetical protein ACRDM0_11830 [Thermoleophilaceae bacterium]